MDQKPSAQKRFPLNVSEEPPPPPPVLVDPHTQNCGNLSHSYVETLWQSWAESCKNAAPCPYKVE